MLRTIFFLIGYSICGVRVFAENKTAQVLSENNIPALEANNARLIVTGNNHLVAVTSVGEND